MMIKLINATFGTDMYVAEDRLEEYLAAGHKLAAEPKKPIEEPEFDDVPRRRRKRD